MQTLRKKTSPLKYKNETSRFLGEGVSFKAKLIGILEVSEARGDRMCQEALADLKMAIRAAGEHKQRITINIAIDGLRLRDEKTGDSLYHHPVHKISFIAQDMTDSRAFGYIFGSPDTGHRFFGIKTDKAASQVVIAMRDLFQVVFALKKKEIELAKQHLDKNRYASSSIFSDTTVTSTSKIQFGGFNKGLIQDSANKPLDAKTSSDSKADTPAVADLVDLELELSSLQQGITQMERITPSDPFGSKDDPFGDSFTSYPPKPILPPPPSAKDRSSRTSESSSMFSPKTPRTGGSGEGNNVAESLFSSDRNFNFSHELNSSHDEPTSGEWYTPAINDKVFDEPPLVPEPSKEKQHELTKQEIMSQFDVFTELDPLGRSTGKIKPYVDKKDFFQELKNPPKKVLNDLVSAKQPQDVKLFNANFEQLSATPKLTNVNGTFTSDPFGDDPFDKTDPFADTEFSRQDPFESENIGVVFKDIKQVDFAEQFKFPSLSNESISILNSKLSKSPNKVAALEKQMSLVIGPMRGVQFNKQNTFDDKLSGKILQIHENRSLDMSSESECAPEPPPRPAVTILQIKPPPLPPKKQPGDLCIKPPPRPPYSEESHYDYMDNYETGAGHSESKKFEKSPPLPAPARKVKLNADFTTPPQRPKKQFNLQQGWSSEEDYLTPISYPNQTKEFENPETNAGPILLPPPQRSIKKMQSSQENVVVTSFLESKPNIVTPNADQNVASLEGLDITLSQLTLSGLNEVASKLNIPASQLSNMTLVQLTEYISNFVKSKTEDVNHSTAQFSDFKADFSNFNNFNDGPHDKYAVFRELLEEEIKQTKIDTEPEEHIKERKKEEKLSNLDVKINENDTTDRYAALREIANDELKQVTQEDDIVDENTINEAEVTDHNKVDDEVNSNDTKLQNKTNIINSEKLQEQEVSKDCVIEYNVESKQDTAVAVTQVKSPVKIKSPIPEAVNDVIQTNRLTSGSLSDVVSGSSPEIDNTGSTSEVIKNTTDAAGESWAIFDQPNLSQQVSRDKQSEEGVSPWSSDSKEFGNGSPPEWRQRTDSGSGPERWASRRREQEGWWDTSAEPEVQYMPSNRRSTDSYEEEGDYYERPARRRRQMTWGHGGEASPAAGGHSSSSRDASPWEEEPRRRERELREHRETWSSRHSRQQHSFERTRDRRHADSWDEEDDYEYDEEHSGRYHWPERHREVDKDRHMTGVRERDAERWPDDWGENRRYRRKRENDRDRWCCPDWEQDIGDQSAPRYSGSRWRDRKHEERYYSREAQESPWEEEYSNEQEASQSRYLMANKRNWKRPSSASEMDRKTGETKTRLGSYYMGTGGSDSERDRRYKSSRRSKSRDSQFSESVSQPRHKIDPNLTLRVPYRTKQYSHQKSPLEMEFSHDFAPKKLESTKTDLTNKRFATVGNRKKTKDTTKTDQLHTFPRKTTFENNFAPSGTESSLAITPSPRFTFENDFETSEPESTVISKPLKSIRHQNLFDSSQRMKPKLRYDTRKTKFKEDTQISPSRSTQKSPFEDDFSPPIEKPEAQLHKNLSKSSIKEEIDVNEEEDSFSTNNFDKNTIRKKILSKSRLSSNFHNDTNLKKSESVNIFARESDPFDDEFFCGRNMQDLEDSPHNSEQKWTENFEEFDFEGQK